MTADITLVLGGARSGKTAHALRLTEDWGAGRQKVYVATAQAFDDEMRERIERHQKERDESWTTVEAPDNLPAVIRRHAAPDKVLLVDCLTLWLSNCMLAERDLDAERQALVAALGEANGPVVLVSNEVGLSIVPENKLARRYRDEAGWTNQAVAAIAAEVIFVAAGLPLTLKDNQN